LLRLRIEHGGNIDRVVNTECSASDNFGVRMRDAWKEVTRCLDYHLQHRLTYFEGFEDVGRISVLRTRWDGTPAFKWVCEPLETGGR